MSLHTQPLNEQEALVVRLRDEEKLGTRDIAALLGVTKSRMPQVLAVAEAKLKDVAEHGEDGRILYNENGTYAGRRPGRPGGRHRPFCRAWRC